MYTVFPGQVQILPIILIITVTVSSLRFTVHVLRSVHMYNCHSYASFFVHILPAPLSSYIIITLLYVCMHKHLNFFNSRQPRCVLLFIGLQRHPLGPYLDYVGYLFQSMDPIPEQERFEVICFLLCFHIHTHNTPYFTSFL